MSKRIEKRIPAAAGRMLVAPTARTKPQPPPAQQHARPASKISVTVDADVLQDVRKVLRGTGLSLSAHVTEALQRDLRRRRLQQLIEAHEAERGVIGEDELSDIKALWQG